MNAKSKAARSGEFNSRTTRRQFLRYGMDGCAAAVLASVPGIAAASQIFDRGEKSVILVDLFGGPSHLDMYDMKPGAPAEIRGEFRPIGTNVPGVRVCEHLPLHARIADKFAIVNGVEFYDRHDALVTSEAGSGFGARVTDVTLPESGAAPALLEIKNTRKVSLPYGDWDTHGCVLGRDLMIFDELRAKLPAYDRLIYDLVTGLHETGRENDVLVVVRGEFGRTPWINGFGGRNHWAPCGSVLFAGGGLKMGQTIGDTGPIGEREQSRSQPYAARHIITMIYRHLGADVAAIVPGAETIAELV